MNVEVEQLRVKVKQEPSEGLRSAFLKLLGFLSYDTEFEPSVSEVLRFVAAWCRTLSANSEYGPLVRLIWKRS